MLRQADSWHQPTVALSEPGAEQAGVVVAYDVKSGAFRSIYGMGRHNHENSVGIPGYGHPVVLSGDDTFDAPGIAALPSTRPRAEDDVWNDNGTLYAFKADDPLVNDYGDVTEAMSAVPGRFIPVPRTIATGKIDGQRGHCGRLRVPEPAELGDPQRPAVGSRALEQPEQRLPVHSHRGHRLRPKQPDEISYIADTGRAAGDPQSCDRAAPARCRRDRRSVPERSHLEADLGLESSRGDARHPAGRELRRSRVPERQRRPPARQPRDDRRRPIYPRGHGHAQQPVGGVPDRHQRPRVAVCPRQRQSRSRCRGKPGSCPEPRR